MRLTATGIDDGTDDATTYESLDDVVRAVLAGRGTSRGLIESILHARYSTPGFEIKPDSCDLDVPLTPFCEVHTRFAYTNIDIAGPDTTMLTPIAGGLHSSSAASASPPPRSRRRSTRSRRSWCPT
jgi:hypothetical protein